MAARGARQNIVVLVLVNPRALDYGEFHARLEPYLRQFGVPFETCDVSVHPVGKEIGDHSLLIIGRRGLGAPRRFLTPGAQPHILAAVHSGTGVASFDGVLAPWYRGSSPAPIYQLTAESFGTSFSHPVDTD